VPKSGDRRPLRAAIERERSRTVEQIANLQLSFDGIVEATEQANTDDEHDPEGATIAYERAQVAALLRQGRLDLVALDEALERIDAGQSPRCAVCGRTIAMARLLALPGVRTCIVCAT
jgi:RNA polymerase-binding transcription factor DksA